MIRWRNPPYLRVSPKDHEKGHDKMIPMRTYTMVAEPEDGGGYFVTVPALPGCFTRGSTIGGQLGSGG
jgi:hypothetical protein